MARALLLNYMTAVIEKKVRFRNYVAYMKLPAQPFVVNLTLANRLANVALWNTLNLIILREN